MAGGGDLSNSDTAINGASKALDLRGLQTSSRDPSREGLLAQLSDNPFFTAGFGLAGLGAALALARRGVGYGAALLKRRLLVDVEINVKDESYQWFLYWMTKHQQAQLAKTSTSHSSASTSASTPTPGLIDRLATRFLPGIRHLSIETVKENLPNGSMKTHFALVPGPGRHVLRYKNAFLMVERAREKTLDFQLGKPWETVTLTTLYSQRHVFEDIFTEAHHLVRQATEGKTVVYRSITAGWERSGEPRRKRSLDSVILDRGIKERILEDVNDFIRSSKWYYDRGIPYRRGYLLHGPPGSGKTSFIQALAGELDYNIAMLNLSERGLTDDRLQHLLTMVPKRTLVLLEDADAAFGTRRVQSDADGYRGANVTFSGLLNALDGVGSAEERLLFLTTNHVERMDAALVRPGRVDMSVRLGDASRWQVEQFWERFYGELDHAKEWRAKFLQRLEELGVVEADEPDAQPPPHPASTAALQGLFLYNKGDMDGAIAMAVGLIPEEARRRNLHGEKRAAVGA